MRDGKKRKIFIVVALLGIIIGECLISYYFKDSNFFNERLIQENKQNELLIISGGVVCHHLLAGETIEQFFQKLSQYQGIENIVILSLDHYGKAEKQGVHFLTVKQKENLNINKLVINSLIEKNQQIGLNEADVFNDQGIATPLIYLSKYFSDVFLIPILISPLAGQDEVKNLIDEINFLLPEGTIIIGSVDFSHYLPDNLLRLHDIKSIRVLLNFEESEFSNIDVDSWQALYGVRYFAKLKHQEHPFIINHKTSFDYFSELPSNSQLAQKGGTSCFNVIFGQGKAEKILNQNSVLVVGDIMMGREVQALTNQFGLSYPFEQIKNIFKGIDIIFGNLEGPIMEKAPVISLTSMNFAYPVEIIQELKKTGFNLLTLANNHTLDKGGKVLEETRNYLLDYGIQPLGDYQSCDEQYYYRYQDILFIGANLVYKNQYCVAEIEKNIKEIKQKEPMVFIIVVPHWGIEYVHLPNMFQEKTAHILIEAGADLIIGHHPHVVQSIEEYKGKLIFYSLGNFVFDMYASLDTQQELALGIGFQESKLTIYLVPLQSHKSQLSLMSVKEKEDFLSWLAQISSPSLSSQIKNGLIQQKIKN